MTIQLSKLDQESIVASIKKNEVKTSAEIFAVFTQRSDDYRFIAYSFLSFWIFIVSALLVIWLEWQQIDLANIGWGSTGIGIGEFVWCQLIAFLCGVFCFRLFPKLAVMLAPGRITNERAHNNAVKQFLAHGIHNTSGRTGVLVFVSLDERYAEILVDGDIEEKIGREWLLEKVGMLIDHCREDKINEGYMKTIEDLGDRLAQDFPPDTSNENELEDRFVIL